MDAWPKTRRKISDNPIPCHSEPRDQKDLPACLANPARPCRAFYCLPFNNPRHCNAGHVSRQRLEHRGNVLQNTGFATFAPIQDDHLPVGLDLEHIGR